ncbi:hypothetical protein P7K49_031292 [Saguinus oedipus]|uniref:Uncharacterized protein n=1 Tax=Saguinus oedipus TaxID=9490 RepID=A0ABQ9TZP6_SAGOE|nr:hypothetical protein P7K49_031292 [Saguinus oedipus]
MEVPAYSPLGDQLFLERCEPAPKSCQALGPEVRNNNGREGDPEDITETQRSGVQGRKSYSQAAARRPQPRGPDRKPSSSGTAERTGNLPPQGQQRGSLQPHHQLGREAAGTVPSKPREQPGCCGLDYKSSDHSGTLGLPKSVQNKVLRLLMIKMSPAPCPSATGLTRRSEEFSPLTIPRAQASSHSSHAGKAIVSGVAGMKTLNDNKTGVPITASLMGASNGSRLRLPVPRPPRGLNMQAPLPAVSWAPHPPVQRPRRGEDAGASQGQASAGPRAAFGEQRRTQPH